MEGEGMMDMKTQRGEKKRDCATDGGVSMAA